MERTDWKILGLLYFCRHHRQLSNILFKDGLVQRSKAHGNRTERFKEVMKKFNCVRLSEVQAQTKAQAERNVLVKQTLSLQLTTRNQIGNLQFIRVGLMEASGEVL